MTKKDILDILLATESWMASNGAGGDDAGASLLVDLNEAIHELKQDIKRAEEWD